MSDLPQLAALRSRVRFGQFVSVGAVGAVFDSIVLTGLHIGLDVPELDAKIAGIETAIVVMYLLNEHWTFSAHGVTGKRPFLRRLLRSHLVRAGGVSVQLVLYWILTNFVTISLTVVGVDWWFLLASVSAIGMAMFVNYVFESLFTWRVHLHNAAGR